MVQFLTVALRPGLTNILTQQLLSVTSVFYFKTQCVDVG